MSYKATSNQSNAPSYLRPMYNFPEHKQSRSVLPQIKIEKPWNSPVEILKLNSSYANSFTPQLYKTDQIQSTAKKILGNSNLLTSSYEAPFNSLSPRPLESIVHDLTGEIITNQRKVSPSNKYSTVKIKPESFENCVSKNIFHNKVSKVNVDWMAEKEKKQFANKFDKGEYIPSVTHMDLYGRKQAASKFEIRELWKSSNFE